MWILIGKNCSIMGKWGSNFLILADCNHVFASREAAVVAALPDISPQAESGGVGEDRSENPMVVIGGNFTCRESGDLVM
jgi:hypothetical protein